MRQAALALATALAAAPAIAQSGAVTATARSDAAPDRRCDAGGCRITMTPAQLLSAAEGLVGQGRYREAKPLVDALRLAPGHEMQSRFLAGMIASRTGDLAEAEAQFKAILANDPRQTRVRLELGKIFLAQHRTASADGQFRIAAQDAELPPEVARTIRTVRDTIRGSRTWRLDANAGLAPDTNINNATSAQSITILLGDTPIPIDLNEQAQARSGTGVTGQLSGGLRLPIGKAVSALAEIDATGTNYKGSAFDNYVVQGAAGAEYRLSDASSLSLQAVGAQRWFGGQSVTRQIGVRGGGQTVLDTRNRLGVQIDIRRTSAQFDRSYDGWQGGVYGTFERAITRTVVASLGPFARRDWLREAAFSNTEYGGNVGVGGELRYGINVGASIGVSRAVYDAPLAIFDLNARTDTRIVARTTLGNRKLRVFGLSPQVTWSYTRIDSSLAFYDSDRSRFEFTLAKYF